MRGSGLITHLESLGFDVQDFGDVVFELPDGDHEHMGAKHLRSVMGFNEMLSKRVAQVIGGGRMCLTLGGDHSIGVGTVHGAVAALPETSVLWIDAHADLNTPLTSPSGNVHGMPVSFCLKELAEFHTPLAGVDWHAPQLSAQHIAFIGLRDVDPYEKLIIDQLNLCAISMEELHSVGLAEALKYALSRIDPDGKRHLHVSFDIDALDPLEAPSTGTPVRGGLTLREGVQLLRTVQRTGRLTAVDIVEVNPLLGSPSQVQSTLEAARHLAAAAAGHYLGGFPPTNNRQIPRP